MDRRSRLGAERVPADLIAGQGRRLGGSSAPTRREGAGREETGGERRRLGARPAANATADRQRRGGDSLAAGGRIGGPPVLVAGLSSAGAASGAPRLVAAKLLPAPTGARGRFATVGEVARVAHAVRARPAVLVWWGTVAAVSVAELMTAYADPRAGTLAHLVILLALLGGAAFAPALRFRQALLTLTLAPLIRIVSLAAPLAALPQLSWFLLTAAPLLATAALIARECGWRLAEIGLCLAPRRWWPLEGVVILSGLALGGMEYAILRPAPLPVPPGAWGVVLAALVLWAGTGVLEEVLFRGVLQRAASAMMPSMAAIVVVSFLFAALHIGYKSPIDFVFVFLVAVYFALVVRRTGSLWGVSVAHGLTNTMLFVVLPRASISWALLSTTTGGLAHLLR